MEQDFEYKKMKEQWTKEACEWLTKNLPVMSDKDIAKQQWMVITGDNLKEILKDFKRAMSK